MGCSRGIGAAVLGDKGRGYTLYVANRQFGQQGDAFHQDFTDLLEADYGAELEPLDFAGDPDGARKQVNAWADDATHGTIPPLFPPGSIDNTTVLVLANAIYFNAAWAKAFDSKLTRDGAFHLADGSTVSVPMMHRSGSFGCTVADPSAWPTPTTEVIELPYADNEVSMLVVVPPATDGLSAVEAEPSSGWLDGEIEKLGTCDLALGLPRFSVTWHASLVQPLEKLGMTDAFSSKADLSGIADAPLFVQDVEHSAYVKVDEHGTTAAAATGTSVGKHAAPAPFDVDHPFLFVIRDRLTGSLLFIGRLEDPTQK